MIFTFRLTLLADLWTTPTKKCSFTCVVPVFFDGCVFLQVLIVYFQAPKILFYTLLWNAPIFCWSHGSAQTHSLLWVQFFTLLLERTFHLLSPDCSNVSDFTLSGIFLRLWHLQSITALSYFLSKFSLVLFLWIYYSYESLSICSHFPLAFLHLPQI